MQNLFICKAKLLFYLFFSLKSSPLTFTVIDKFLSNSLLNNLSLYLLEISVSVIKLLVITVSFFAKIRSLITISKYSLVTLFKIGSVPKSSIKSTSHSKKWCKYNFLLSLKHLWYSKKFAFKFCCRSKNSVKTFAYKCICHCLR